MIDMHYACTQHVWMCNTCISGDIHRIYTTPNTTPCTCAYLGMYMYHTLNYMIETPSKSRENHVCTNIHGQKGCIPLYHHVPPYIPCITTYVIYDIYNTCDIPQYTDITHHTGSDTRITCAISHHTWCAIPHIAHAHTTHVPHITHVIYHICTCTNIPNIPYTTHSMYHHTPCTTLYHPMGG